MKTLSRLCLLALVALLAGLLISPSGEALNRKERKAVKARVEALEPEFRSWVQEVELLIADEELLAFLDLEKDYQRKAFIKRFWQERDPFPSTARNEFRDRWHERREFAVRTFGDLEDVRSRILLLNDAPIQRLEVKCPSRLHPMEIWVYAANSQVPFQFAVVFYRPYGTGPFRIWYPQDGLAELFDFAFQSGRDSDMSLEAIQRSCYDGDLIAKGIALVLKEGPIGYARVVQMMEEKPDPPAGEWVATFAAYSTDVPEDAGRFESALELLYPGRQQSRTVLQGVIKVATANAGQADFSGHRSFNFLLNGEILRDDELFDSFRYKFDLPSAEVTGDDVPLIFQRSLRPGEYTLVAKLEDLNSGRYSRHQQTITVPKLDNDLPAPPPDDPLSAALLRQARKAITSGETTIELVQPHGELHTGLIRFETLTTGESFHKVSFFLDGKQVFTKKRPPYSVELDLGSLPRTRNLRVVGLDEAGEEMASDELSLNVGGHRFDVRLLEPRRGKTYSQSLIAQAEVSTPESKGVERVEFFLNETRLATLYQPPFSQAILLPDDQELAYVRAVAFLTDGNSTEDLVFINAPDYLEEVDIQFVELFTTVLDRSGRPINGLGQELFSVAEDGVDQSILRFEQVRDLPIHAGILLDVSASMDDSLDQVRQAALGFFESAVGPKDRAALITFNDRPHLAVKFSNEVEKLAGGLAGLKAERGTSLYDSLIFALYYFNGIRGQKAVLMLSDGKDESSRFSFEETVEYAQRAGVTIYAIGIKEAAKDSGAKRKLTRFAEETGGRSFFIKSLDELNAVYTTIQEELRSQYLIAYQSTNTSGTNVFREVELKVDRPGTEVKTLRGYYP